MIKEQFINKTVEFREFLLPAADVEMVITMSSGSDIVGFDFEDILVMTVLCPCESSPENRKFVTVKNHKPFVYHYNWDYLGRCKNKSNRITYHIFEVK